jgi:hypothetical protein
MKKFDFTPDMIGGRIFVKFSGYFGLKALKQSGNSDNQ